MRATTARPKVTVTTDGAGVVSHARARLLADLADATTLTEQLSQALQGVRGPRARHDRGRVFVDLAVAIADGAEVICDIAVLADQPALFGPVASDSTCWRLLDALDADRPSTLAGARACGVPKSRVVGGLAADRGARARDVGAARSGVRLRPCNRDRRHWGVPTLRAVSHGVSLAGGLALMAEAVAPRAGLLVLGVPTFGWADGRRLLVERAPVRRSRHSSSATRSIRRTISRRSWRTSTPRCWPPPSAARPWSDSAVVPAACVRAIVERLAGPLEVMTFPVSHDTGPAMRAWDRFDERWLALALGGVPTGFGRQRNAAASCTQVR